MSPIVHIDSGVRGATATFKIKSEHSIMGKLPLYIINIIHTVLICINELRFLIYFIIFYFFKKLQNYDYLIFCINQSLFDLYIDVSFVLLFYNLFLINYFLKF